ncbi:NAD(P)-dependent dehydrogenase, short-chain alcohol dehydrogenase family [Mitsuaria sp. PDC51]|jgi:NAD(P)-dependent dehydrogenase (short-subunit alcohol dehydrogenase family)|uniref:SDR family NAD(P)-dependent oxidoreductase n=1 Tax=unclassified Roseateles TaxID=2626991 RepID=UPI0008EE5419|nr:MULTISPECIES: SDR family NAD(P)-dependent oxidoreductase [unclassified Roseateles]MBB3280524.1 NAD(P)-dependent dehydrogenase (short-subunit alcohol dehydrogenase family) [Mitsuaria sp. BK037]MBB3292569.1 NAD(P)-dependent dehydrogenase (short-subunit alcohol dehydrogenase family) [Mitsuaria sp. BK041]MBB3361786.1 NAD(P)-dependent dehydrogenase (short-subunit alcohol dehydrogenase family) [Mitsuaria sp. BK045]SFR75954.1 NAD(P)-dependent dehydrogenase, short-chain alcohol dehydrogenase family 
MSPSPDAPGVPNAPTALTVITGSSRGLGEALARQSLAAGHLVVGIARGRSEALERFAHERGLPLQQWQADLSAPLAIARHLADWLRTQPRDWRSATLINNAGVVTPPGPIDGESLEVLSAALRVGLEATVLLSAAFLDATRDWPAARKVLNISSGLGRRAMAGSALYCAAKAGMDNLSRAMALDEEHKAAQGERAARVVSLAPGIIDTDMQAQLRGGDASKFPDRDRFAAFKAEGQLVSAEDTATRVLRFLARDDFGQQVLADVRDA